MFGMQIILMPEPTIQVQVRTHHRRRINKKWRKRYGMKTVPDPKVDYDKLLVDERRGVVYVYPCQEGYVRRIIAQQTLQAKARQQTFGGMSLW